VTDRAATLRELRRSGWQSRSVKAELRANLLARLGDGRGIMAGHRRLRGERRSGDRERITPARTSSSSANAAQAKRGWRGSLSTFSDEWLPVVRAASSMTIRSHPSARLRRRSSDEHGDETPIDWLPRDRRYSEKLATPDITIADLIGEVDPIRVAEGRYLSDELTLHYGLIPRTKPRHLRDQRAA